MPWTNQTNADLNDGIFSDGGGFPATLHVGLSTTTPANDGTNATEPVGNAYARVAVPAATWDPSTVASPAVKVNGTAVTFPQASGGSWGNITHLVYYNALTAGTVVGFAALTAARQIDDGDTLNFAVGAISNQLS